MNLRPAPSQSAGPQSAGPRSAGALAASLLATSVWASLVLGLFGCHGAPPAPPPAPSSEASVRPGINKDFLDPELDVAKFEQRFEGESREVFVHRARIAALLGLRSGMAVADVGAGTGLFTFLCAPKVGAQGTVWAVDIAPRFVEHLERQAAARKLPWVRAVLCTERSVELPEASQDLVFVCDTYHHFEYPGATMASIHRALRPGGELVVVDFIREPGQSREWILEHVRAGLGEVRREIEEAGFEFVRQEDTPFLRENYCVRFRRR